MVVLHSRFPDVAGSIVPQLMEFLSDANADSAVDVILFVREAFERLPALRADMLAKIFENFPLIKSSKVFPLLLANQLEWGVGLGWVGVFILRECVFF